ncbi:collagen alpha chain CG42342-like [Corticium candelabrum]|uniref:collagen alpha chain CG42342-like n=1 Tax=Corticium candelabrum TaxID=121492 RepID=UPI002E277306|nr:collagen alpha chain CG42342-like [Corticium candelabrum]
MRLYLSVYCVSKVSARLAHGTRPPIHVTITPQTMEESTTKDDMCVCNSSGASRPGLGWTALVVVSLLNALLLCSLHSVYHRYHDDRLSSSFSERLDALEASMSVIQSRLTELLSVDASGSGYGNVNENWRSVIRHRRSQLDNNSASDGRHVALDVGTAIFTALRAACTGRDKLCVPGPRGIPGIPGLKGDPGREGFKGDQGELGHPGVPGANGTDGLKGEKGAKGGLGQTGRSGSPGLKGDRGEPGLEGSAGATGVQGVPGPRGLQGIPGLEGKGGRQGVKGHQGVKGEKGESGFIQVVSNQRQESERVSPTNSTVIKGSGKSELTVSNPGAHKACNSGLYKMLNDSWRRESVMFEGECTQQYNVFESGWYRFSESLGGMIKTRCPKVQGCRAVAPGWMKGRHPNRVGVAISRLVCFSLDGDCCLKSVRMDVINCGDYYVYNLPEIPRCYYEYCGNA